MFTARGMSLVRLPSGFLQASVSFEDDETKEEVHRESYVVLDKRALEKKVAAQLHTLKASKDEQVLVGEGIIGQVLGQV